MPYRIDTYTDENVFSNTFGDTYTQTVWDSSCGESSNIAMELSVTSDEGSVWELYSENVTFTYPITMYVDGVECTRFTATGKAQTVVFECDGGVMTINGADTHSKIYFNKISGSGGNMYVVINSLNLSYNVFTESVNNGSFLFSYNDSNRVLSASNVNSDNFEVLFFNQKELTYVDISPSVNVRNMLSAFMYCSSLETVVMPPTMSRLTTLQNTFSDCSSLHTISLPDNLPLLQDFNCAFDGCTLLETIDMPSSTPYVSELRYAFVHCSKLKTLDLSGIDTTNLKTSGSDSNISICRDCVSLTDLNLNGWNFSGLHSLADRLDIASSDNGAKLERIRGDVSGLEADEDWRYYTYLDRESVMVLINGLSATSKSLTLSLYYGVYALLNADDIKVATDKGWTVTSVIY